MTNISSNKMKLSPEHKDKLIRILKIRFESNMFRHKNLEWSELQVKLEAYEGKLWSLNEMEKTGGDPDVVGYDRKTDEYIFYILKL